VGAAMRGSTGRRGRWSGLLSIGVGIAAPILATVVSLVLGGGEVLAAAASIYMLAVVLAAAIGGSVGGIVAAVLGSLGLNYFFTEPLHTFRVTHREDLAALAAFLIAALLVGSLLARALAERDRATRRERESRLLNYLATKLLSGQPLELVLEDFAAALLQPFGLARSRIDVEVEGMELHLSSAVPEPRDGPSTAVGMVAGGETLGRITAIRPEGQAPLVPAELELLEACAAQAAVAIERARLDRTVEVARVTAETNSLRAALFSAVTHDLRTPLASIMTAASSLLDASAELDPEQRRELLSTVLEETDRLNRLVGNILDLAKVRAGALVPAKQPTDAEEVLEAVLHRMAPRLSRTRVRTVVRPDLPEIPVDPVQLDQVLTNLLENAARFSPVGGEIVVTVAPWRGAVQFRVADQGPGIPQADRERVFDAFVRGDASDGRSGSGLGLAIARAIVLAHGGRIWIEGAPSGGTAVVFELPVSDAEPVAQEPAP
jgi:two-component system, OmpR family, sensor histidine kinase KdpD